MARYQNLLNDSGFSPTSEDSPNILTVRDIHYFLDQKADATFDENVGSGNLFNTRQRHLGRNALWQREKEYREKIRVFKKKEEAVYRSFGVHSIEELQGVIESAAAQVNNFSACALNSMPAIKQLNPSSWTEDEVLAAIEENLTAQLESKIDEMTEAQIWETVLSEFDKASQSIRNKGVDKKSFGKKWQFEKVKDNGRIKIKVRAPQGSVRYYKKVAISALNLAPEGDFGYSGEFKVDLTSPQPGNLTYYPYFKLTKDQKTQAVSTEGDLIWDNFKQQLKALAAPEMRRGIDDILSSGIMVREDFFADTPAQIKGVLGELATIAIFSTLSPSSIQYVGNVLNNKGKKIGVDVVLGGAGIQVKNYSGYDTEKGDWGFWSSQESIGLNTFLEKLEAGGGENGRMAALTLGDWYTVRAFHVRATSDEQEDEGKHTFIPTQKRLEIYDRRVKDFLQGYINAFLPIEELSADMLKDGQKLINDGNNFQNLFYFVGGKTLMPVSKILTRYLKYMENLRATVNTKVAGATNNFYVKMTYKGDDYRKYYDGAKREYHREEFKDFKYDNVYNDINIQYKINFDVDYIMDEVLSRKDID